MRSVLALALFLVSSAALSAEANCKIVALHDSQSIEDPDTILKRGTVKDYITEYDVDDKTGAKKYCQHGGYCFNAYVEIDGKLVKALELTNCQIDMNSRSDSDGTTSYSLKGFSPNSPASSHTRNSTADTQILGGSCSESFVTEGRSDSPRESVWPFECNTASIYFLDNQNKHIRIKFTHSTKNSELGFEGIMQSDGRTMSVSTFYWGVPPILSVKDGHCTFVSEDRQITHITCAASYFGNATSKTYVQFEARSGQ